MKSSKLIIPVVVLISIIAVLGYPFIPKAAVQAAVQASVQKADIKLEANTAGLKFTGASGDLGTCKSKKKTRYCVNVPEDDEAEITFRLVGSPDWGFKRMQLVAEPSEKLDFGNQAKFGKKMQADFYVKVNGVDVHPDTNGIIKLGGSPGVGQNFTLIDKNKLKQIYSYQLEVCNENDDCHRTDPRVENEG